jgi:MFS transporter, PPP family, 3-phenylpropionic acid transporter
MVKGWFIGPFPFHMAARIFSIRFSLCFAFIALSSGLQLPFLPLWLSNRGLTTAEIALVLGAMTATRIFAIPFAAYLADFHFPRRTLIIAFGFASFLSYAALGVAHGVTQILFFGVLVSFCNSPVFILAEGFSSEASAAHGVDYGRIRLWASLSFLTGNLGGGVLLTIFPIGNLMLIMMTAQGVAAMVFLLLPEDPVARAPRQVHIGAFSSIGQLMSGGFLLLLAAASLGQSSHAMLYSFGPVHWDQQGFSKMMIGSFWAASIFAEVNLFLFGKRLIERFGPQMLVIGGAAGGALRWFLMSFDLNYSATLVVQMGHAISFAMLHLGTMHYMLKTVPPHLRNSAQGIYSACSGGIAMCVMMWFAGKLYEPLQGRTYLVMMAVSLCAMSFALALRRLTPRALPELATSRLQQS